MTDKKITIVAKDGFKLGAHIREPEADFKGVVQINSGTGIPQEFSLESGLIFRNDSNQLF